MIKENKCIIPQGGDSPSLVPRYMKPVKNYTHKTRAEPGTALNPLPVLMGPKSLPTQA